MRLNNIPPLGVVIPLGVLIGGLAYWIKRRKL